MQANVEALIVTGQASVRLAISPDAVHERPFCPMRAYVLEDEADALGLSAYAVFCCAALGALAKGRHWRAAKESFVMARARLLSREPQTASAAVRATRAWHHACTKRCSHDVGQVASSVSSERPLASGSGHQHDVHQLGWFLLVERGRRRWRQRLGEAVRRHARCSAAPSSRKTSCRSMPADRAASSRLMPSRALAIARMRRATRVSASALGQLAKNCRRVVLAYLQRSHDPLPQMIEARK